MTFRPYAWKIRLGNTENFLDIDDLTDGYLLWRNGSKVTSTLIDQGKLSLSTPQNPNDAATKQYVDDNLTADESARVAADIHLQAQIDALMGTSLTSGDKGDITIAADGYAWNIDAGAVTNAKLAAVGSGIIKGRASAGTGAVEDLTGTQATALLDVFTTEAKGLVPAAASGGTTNFLRADGVWAAPPAGTVTDVSVVSANGLAGTVANSGTTPAITLSTSVSGVLKGNGTAISAAISGTDYAPATSGTSILAGNGSGGFSSVSVGSGLALADGVLSATPSSSSVVSVTEGSAPSATAGTGKLWASSAADARPYWLDDTGQSFNLTLDRFNTLTPAASVVIDTSPALPIFNSLALNQNTTFTTSNLGSGRSASVRIICDGTDRQLTFPGTWKWLGSGPPSGLLANNVGYLSVVAFGSTDTDVVAAWSYENMAEPGTVTSVSVAAANGLAGTVSNSGTTPSITLSTSVTGVLKGDGTAISAAVSGTDYAPATSGTAILKGNGAGGFSSAAAGTDYAPATSGTSILYGNNSGGFSNVTVGTGLTFSAGTLSSNLVGVTDGDKGDITVASTGTSWTIDSGAVTNAKLANVATATIKGRTTAGTGAVEDLTGTQATALLDTFTTAAKGLVPAATGGGTTNFLRADGTWAAPPAGTITSVSVVSANGLAGTVANATTTPAITLSTSITGLLQGNGTAISAATIGTGLSFAAGTLSNTQIGLTDGDKGDITVASSGTSWTIDSGAVTNAKLASVATATFKGRTTAGTGAVEDLTAAQATALLNNFTSTLKGLTPASGGGTANYLRADGTWAAPPGSGGTVTSVSVVSANGLGGTVANATTTPAITLSTSVSGLLKGNGTGISAAISGTDYAPATSGASILSGNSSGGFSSVTVGTGLSFAAGTLSSSLVGVTDGDKGDITVASSGTSWTVDSGAITNAKLANVGTATFKGRTTAGTGVVEDLTATQATALLNTFTTSAKGLVPAATGGGTTNFLRADGAWAAPSAGTVTSVSVVSANGLSGTVANATTTPAITLSTSISGLLKGSGGAVAAAIPGTDYAPAGSYVTTDTVQTITAAKAIDIADDIAPALRITQRGAGEALRVEDETNPDSSPFVIDKNGDVGIGTASPGARLDVNASGSSSITLYSAEFKSSSGTTNAGRVLFSQGSTYGMAIAPAATSATTGRVDFQYITRSTGAVETTPLSIRGDGNVGIGTQTPSKRLHVSGSGLLIDGASSVESAPLAARLIVDSGASTGHTLADFRNNNGSTLFIGGANVGIGTSSPSASNRLTISASTNSALASIAISNTHISTGTWEIAVPGSTKVLDFAYNGSTRGYLSNSVNQGIIDFTGQHRSASADIGQLEDGGIGLIVVAAGDYQSLSGASSIDINEALPKVTLSSARNQKSVFGVISDREDDDSSTREYWVGNFVNVYDKAPGDNRLVINSLGEGAIWVCNINGNLENGDFITSCEVPGYGMRQDDDLMHNYTVAKITCDCDFDLASTTYTCQEFEFNGIVYRKAFVGCTYHCG